MPVAIKRAYLNPSTADGYRVLVDGLWPHGVKKEDLKIGEWMRGIAPSARLRAWYGHKPERWEEFRKRYQKELSASPRKELLDELRERAQRGTVTLVFSARDGERSNAAVLAELVESTGRRNAA